MNNFQAKIRLDEVNTSYTQEGKMTINGRASFKFFDREEKVGQMQFVAYGNSAVHLNSSGVGSVHVVSGRLNVHQPTDANPNHSLVLTINHALAIGGGASKEASAPTLIYQAPDRISVQPQRSVVAANGNVDPFNSIPF